MNELESLRAKVDELAYANDCLKRELQQQRATDAEDAFARAWKLTPLEAKVIGHLYVKRGRCVSTDAMMDFLYSDRPNDEPETKIVTVLRCKMRKKLPVGTIETVWYQGQRLSDAGIETCDFILESAGMKVAA